jgi:hypothetical protein
MTALLNTPEYRLTYNRALAAIPEHVVGREGVPDLTDPLHSYLYLEKRRQVTIDSVKQRPLLRLWDGSHRYIGQIAQEKSVTVEELMTDSGAGTCVVRHDNWLSQFILYDRRAIEDLHFTVDPIPTMPDWRNRWGGKILAVNAKRDREGLHTVELEALSNREHYKHILAGANPISPPEAQFPKMWVLPLNCRTAVGITAFINLARQYCPFLSIPTNIFNPMGWLGGGGFANLNPLNWPVQVAFINPLFDQSRFSVLSSRWSDMHTVTAPMLEDAGCMVRAYTWLEGDPTSPHTELRAGLDGIPLFGTALRRIADKIGIPASLDELCRPTRNCVVLSVEDKSGTTGPTGTLIDGPIKLAAATADDMITEIVYPVDENVYDADTGAQEGAFFQKLTLTAAAAPWPVFRDNDYSGIIESNRTVHSCTAKTIMVGGHSPSWVNQLQTFAIKYGLSELSQALLAMSPGMGAPGPTSQIPQTPGLEEMYQGQLDDCLLAFQRYTDIKRALWMGDHAYLEHKEQGAGTAYTVAGVLDLRTGHWKTRDYTSFKTTIRNGAPYLVNKDFTLGDRLAFQQGNLLYVDQCYGIKLTYDRDTFPDYDLQIGKGTEEEDPVMRATRTLAQLWNTVGLAMGSSEMF